MNEWSNSFALKVIFLWFLWPNISVFWLDATWQIWQWPKITPLPPPSLTDSHHVWHIWGDTDPPAVDSLKKTHGAPMPSQAKFGSSLQQKSKTQKQQNQHQTKAKLGPNQGQTGTKPVLIPNKPHWAPISTHLCPQRCLMGRCPAV